MWNFRFLLYHVAVAWVEFFKSEFMHQYFDIGTMLRHNLYLCDKTLRSSYIKQLFFLQTIRRRAKDLLSHS
jgi:hypothetical protein